MASSPSALLRSVSEDAVLAALRADPEPLTRAELARRTGLSKPTVTAVLHRLLAAGLARAITNGQGATNRGAKFAFCPDAAGVIALDIGAHRVRGALADLDGNTARRIDRELASPDAAGVLAACAEVVDAILEQHALGADAIAQVVVSFPGVIDPVSGEVSLATAFTDCDGRTLGADLEAHLRLPIIVDNDANLAALGERRSGAARESDSFAFLSVGTGIGAGIVLGGQLLRGHLGRAGEVEIVLDFPDGRAGAAAISELAAKHSCPDHAPEAVFADARRGDAKALAVLEEYGRRLARYVLLLVVVDVELVVLGGGIGQNDDLLVPVLERHIAARLPHFARIVPSTLGADAPLVGAAHIGAIAAFDHLTQARLAAASRTPWDVSR